MLKIHAEAAIVPAVVAVPKLPAPKLCLWKFHCGQRPSADTLLKDLYPMSVLWAISATVTGTQRPVLHLS